MTSKKPLVKSRNQREQPKPAAKSRKPAQHPKETVQVRESFHVVVECAGEAEQEELYEECRRAGRRCRILTM